MENPNFTKMSPDYKKRFREMIEKDRKEKEKKKNKKKDKGKSRLQQIADKLYGGNK